MVVIPDLDLARIKRYCDGRNHPDFLDKVRVEAHVRGRAVTIVEHRAPWQQGDTGWTESPVARLRYDAVSRRWTLYWFDRNSRGHLYDLIKPGSATELLVEIEEDPTCIFWG